MTQIIPDIINIVIEAIFAILGLFFTGVAVPWLIKTGIPWLKDKRLYGIVTVLVKAAEKQREAGTLPIPKYDYVEQMLEAKGIKVTAEVKAMIGQHYRYAGRHLCGGQPRQNGRRKGTE